MNKKLFALGLIGAAGLFAAAPAKVTPDAASTLTHEDVWLMKRVGAPVPSPDGRWTVFAVTEPAYDPKEQSSDLWLKSLIDDTPARQLTHTKGGESGAN